MKHGRRLEGLALAIGLALAGTAAPAVPLRTGDAVAPGRIASHVNLCSRLHQYAAYSDIWGYTSPDGKEYALLGTVDGVSVVNVTDRAHPCETGFIHGARSAWREIKVYMGYMYVVNETDGGLQIVSLSDPEHPRPVTAYQGFRTAHNLTTELENHMLYVAGSDVAPGGVMMLRLNNPELPQPYRTWDLQYAHDVHVRGDWMYVSAIRAASLYLVDISERRPMSVKGVINGYPSAFTHNAWTNEAGTHLLTTDEASGAAVRMWDITNPAAAVQTGFYKPADSPASIPHNVFVDDHDLAYVSYYTAGVRVVDVSDPCEPEEVAFFDTYPANDAPVFAGCWGVFPFFRNSPELFVASDIQTGLYVLELDRDLIDPATRARSVLATPGATAIAPHRTPSAAPLLLSAPAPNPLAPGASTCLDLALEAPASLRVDVMDAAGRLVRRLVNGPRPAGTLSLGWDGRDAHGRAAAAGVYFLRVNDGDRTASRRVVVTR